jgi:transcriptional regulator with XRE-family HTH domain
MLGRELKARETAGMTQEDLAFRAGVHRTYISYLEHDKYSPSVDMLFRLCDALGISATRLTARVEKRRKRRR